MPSLFSIRSVTNESDDFAVASTVGAILVFPGSSSLVLWKYTSSLPYLSGLAIVIAATMTAPTFSISLCATSYVWLRNWLMRGEDSLHKMLWVSARHPLQKSATIPLHAAFDNLCSVCPYIFIHLADRAAV